MEYTSMYEQITTHPKTLSHIVAKFGALVEHELHHR